MDDKIKVLSFQMSFKHLNKKLYENDIDTYKKAVIVIRLESLQKRYVKIKRMNQPTNSGTKITFESISEQSEYKRELANIVNDGKKLGLSFEPAKSSESNV